MALTPGTPPAIPVEEPNATFLPPGGTRVIDGLGAGVHRFECLIHPWMRSTVEVRHDH